jgi:tetratricopeptide (TPR) repeat protein
MQGVAEIEFSKKALLGATGAAIWDLVEATGGTVLGLLGKPTPKELLDRLRKQWAGALPSLPRNHDLVRGLRTAHLAALDRVARAHAEALKHYPASDVSTHDREFSRWLRAWLDERLRRLLTELDFEAVTAEQVRRALDDMIHPSETEGFAAQALAARRAAEDAALAELQAASSGAVPAFFAAAFRAAGGWYDVYALFVNEEIKTNERFRSIFLAAELVDLKRLVAAVEARIAAALEAGVQALAFRLDSFERWLRDITERLARIEDKVDRGFADVMAALEQRMGVPHSVLRSILRRLAIEEEVPDEAIPARLEKFADDYLKLRADLDRQTNAPAEVEKLRRLARQALDTGDLPGAAARLAEARTLLRAARERMAEEEAMVLGEEAGVALLRGDYDTAVAKRREAAGLVAHDPALAWLLTLGEAEALYRWGEMRGNPEHLRQAVRRYDAALALAPRAERSGDWAETQNDLGNALVVLGERGDDAALCRAVQAYEGALEERTRDREPLAWAITQNNLGGALRVLGERGDDAALRRAIQAFEAAMEECTRDRAPLAWAMAQHNLGSALQTLGKRGDDTTLHRAVQAFEAALEERTRDRAPLDWATTQNNLGNALVALGERGDDAALRRAVQAYEAALEERTRDRVPLAWAMTQNNLGGALRIVGERGDDAALSRAVQAFEAALEERTRDRSPLDWAMTQYNLGGAHFRLGQLGDSTALCRAVQALEAALEEYRHDRAPLEWALTHSNLGLALQTLGTRGDEAALRRAVQSFIAALGVLRRFDAPFYAELTERNLTAARALLASSR